MHVPCECGNRFELSDVDRVKRAGQFVSCPACGVSKRLPAVGADSSRLPSRRRSPVLILGAVAAAVLLLLLFAGLGVRTWAKSAPGGPVAKVVLSPLERAQAAVRDHLRGSLPSGEFEELQWTDYGAAPGCRIWPARKMSLLSESVLRWHADEYVAVKEPGRCARLRFRSEMPLAGPMVQDWTFVVNESGQVFHALSSEDVLLPGESPKQMAERLRDSPEASGTIRNAQRANADQQAVRGFLDGLANGKAAADDEP